MTTIITKNGSGAPTAGQLSEGELAVDLTNKELYTKSGSTVIKIGGTGGGETGTFTDLTATSSFTSPGIDDNATSTSLTVSDTGISVNGLSARLTSGYIQVQDLNTDVSAGTNMGGVEWRTGDSSVSGANRITANIAAIADGTFNAADKAPTALAFSTHGASGVDPVEHMRVTSTGNVGIGTDAPASQLHVKNESGSGIIQLGTAGGAVAREWKQLVSASNGSYYIQDTTAGTNRLAVDTSGNVGIGETAPQTALHITQANDPVITLEDTGFGASATLTGSNGNMRIGSTTATIFDMAGSEKMRLDSSGNVGIGLAPSAWSTGKAVELGFQGNALWGNAADEVIVSQNAYYNAGWKYATARPASHYSQYNATHRWFTAPSGTANSAISWTQAMTIDNSGNVGIGESNPSALLDVSTNAGNGNAGQIVKITNTNASSGTAKTLTIGTDNYFASNPGMTIVAESGLSFGVGDGSDLANQRNLVIDAAGNVGIGTATPTNSALFSTLDLRNTSGGQIVFGRTSSIEGYMYSEAGYMNVAASTGNALRFISNATGGVGNKMTLDTAGNLLVGTTTTIGTGTEGVQIAQNLIITGRNQTSDQTHHVFKNPNGTVGRIRTLNNATDYVTSSDERLKENIVDAPAGNIDAIRVRSFDWKSDGSHQTYGMIAQELVEVAPEAVSQSETKDDMWGVDYSKLVPMMIKEIQDLKAEVAALKGA